VEKIDKLFRTVDIQKIGLDGSWMRNEAIANNMANVNTPGYKRQDVSFENLLKDYLDQNQIGLKTTNSRHLELHGGMSGDLEPELTRESQTSFRKDKNNVDMDIEMAEMTKNSLYYNSLVTQVNNQFRRIKLVVKEGR
jgi:flagellar basal-body rod protein FlgB